MQITTVMAREAPSTMMKSDRMVSTYSFDYSFKVIIPKKKAWLNSEKLPLPSVHLLSILMALVAQGKQVLEFILTPLGTLEVFLWVSALVFFRLCSYA